MNSQIVNPKRYKKTTREKSNKKKIALREKLKKHQKVQNKIKENRIISNKENEIGYIKFNFNSNNSDVKLKKINKNKKNNIKQNNIHILKITCVLIAIFCISFLSKVIVNGYFKDNQNTTIVNLDTGETATLVQDSNIKIGMSKLDTIDLDKTKNIVLNELYNITKLSLIKFDTSYNITYQVAKEIEKINNKEYLITLNDEYKISTEDIKNTVNKIKNIGETNIYYKNISKIADINVIDKNVLKITLSEELPYFIYTLNFPIENNGDKNQSYILLSSMENEIKFKRNISKSTVNEITFKNYTDIDNMIEDFRNNKIDLFTASSDSIMSLVGKHDYSIKKYRDGETLFLFGNTSSRLFSMKEVRRAILYSIDRDQIIRNLNSTFLEKIDIPYIYSDIKYKYDLYGAQNALLSQGWKKSSGIYQKNVEGSTINLEVSILVNGSDNEKLKIVEYIKEMLENNGIKVNLKILQGNDFNNALNNKEYDLVLANVYINNIPDISFIENYLNVNDIILSNINIVKNSSVEDLSKNINLLMENLSEEVACIGIYAKNTNVVYQTNIAGISNISYMNIFNNFENVGKIQSINK